MTETANPVDREFLRQVLARHGDDPQALTELGVRVITGSGAPCSPVNGAALIAAAAEHDHAQAWRYLAGLSAQGLVGTQSLEHAFAALEQAVALDDAEACTQRTLLQTLGWNSVADVECWLAQPFEAELLSSAPRVAVIRHVLPPTLCNYLITVASPKLVRAEIYDLSSGKTRADAMRTNTRSPFSALDINLIVYILRARIAHVAGVAVGMLESPEILHYEVGERYKPHVDYFHTGVPRFAEHVKVHGQRVKTALVYLNEGYEGGETDFPQLGFCFKGGKGDLLLFENVDGQGCGDMRTVHEGRAPTRGEKWLLSQWIRDKAQVFS